MEVTSSDGFSISSNVLSQEKSETGVTCADSDEDIEGRSDDQGFLMGFVRWKKAVSDWVFER